MLQSDRGRVQVQADVPARGCQIAQAYAAGDDGDAGGEPDARTADRPAGPSRTFGDISKTGECCGHLQLLQQALETLCIAFVTGYPQHAA